MLQVELSASVREKFGKGAMRRMRDDGKTPAVLYGSGTKPLALQLETVPFYHELLHLHGRNAMVTLVLDNGETHHVLIKDVQTDPVRDTVVHADFHKIDIEKPKQFDVPVTFIGTAKGVDLGGRLIVEHQTVLLEGLPLDIPDDLKLDITELEIGDKKLLSALDIPGNVILIDDEELVCVKVAVPGKEPEDDEDLDEQVEVEAAEETEAAEEEE